MTKKAVFHDQEIQRALIALHKRELTPEFIAARESELSEDRKFYWKSMAFAVVVILAVVPALTLAILSHLYDGFELTALTLGLLIGMPALMFVATFPRATDHRKYLRRLGGED